MVADTRVRLLSSVVVGTALLLAVPAAGLIAAGRVPTVGEALDSLPVVAVANRLADGLRADPVAPVAAPAVAPEAVTPPAATIATPEPSAIAPTRGFARELQSEGLFISPSGDRIESVGAGLGTPRQLVLSQAAADRFGIVLNPYFDPLRVAVVRDGRAIADLATGVIVGHDLGSAMFGSTEVIDTDLLDELRARVGWSLTAAREAIASRYLRTWGFVPAFVQSDEAYTTYLEAARSNYVGMATGS